MTKPTGLAVAQILDTIVEPYTVVHSDAHPMYKTINFERMRLANIIHIHKNRRDLFRSSYVEGVWWVLKQNIRKMYGQQQSKNLESFVMESWFRRDRDRFTNMPDRIKFVDVVLKEIFKLLN
jgi:hypothetical protein